MLKTNPALTGLHIVFALILAAATSSAIAIEVKVTYSNLTVSGPISFGILPEDFPEAVDVTFEVAGVGTSPSLCGIGTSPGIHICDVGDIQSAEFTLGDLSVDENDLDSMAMEFTQVTRIGDFELTGLSYVLTPPDTSTATNIIIPNNSFQLSVLGHDIGSDLDFSYTWSDSQQEISDSTGAVINIKPGSDPNSINVCSGRTIPVAVFGSDAFDVDAIDQNQLLLASTMVRTVGKSDRSLCAIEDIGSPNSAFFDSYDPNPDGYPDLICHFMTQNLMEDASNEAELQIVGCDDPNDSDGCQSEDTGYSETSAKDSVNIVKDCG